ncbi:MAG: haloacid dehalogenase-like hydrolase [Phycisphaerales bacterium]|nr:haloacid dehalogenase-like hydrolase [Phycisphaerales bacterium]
MTFPALHRPALALLGALLTTACASVRPTGAGDPLPSWREGPAKHALLDFAASAPAGAVAVFDHDGALIAEQPIYLQYAFVIDTLARRAPSIPDWQSDPLLVAALAGDYDTVLSTRGALARLSSAAGLDGIGAEDYTRAVQAWLVDARHPTLGRPWRECVYRPMLELIQALEAAGVECFIVTGAGSDFVRAAALTLYGLPPHRVIGDPDQVREARSAEGAPVIVRSPMADAPPFPGKPTLIHRHIGARPALAFGAGDGDLPMLEFTGAGAPPRVVALLHHTDAAREFAYDRASRIGRLDAALDLAAERGWIVVDMSRDWSEVWPEAR